jgi:hypothetical protein
LSLQFQDLSREQLDFAIPLALTPEFQEYVLEFFAKLLNAHGLAATTRKDRVMVDGHFPAFRGWYEPPSSRKETGRLVL